VHLIRTLQENEELFTALSGTSIPNIVKERIVEILTILEEQYRSTDWDGGMVFFFTTDESYQKEISDICEQYYVNRDEWEYSEIIGEQAVDGVEWWEELYLLSSGELSLIFIHPREDSKTKGGQ
jgi:hypothetical protein